MRLSNAVTSSPVIEYRLIKHEKKGNDNFYYYGLINLTNNAKFSDLTILIQLDPNDSKNKSGRFTDGGVEPVPPAAPFQIKPNISLFTCTYTIPYFNPKEEYRLRSVIQGESKVPFLSLSIDEGPVVILRKASLFTFFIKNEEYVYGYSFLVIIILIIIYFLNLKPETLPKSS